MNKTEMIVRHMEKAKHKGITQLEATNLYGCTRLSSIIFSLRGKGYKIKTHRMEGQDRYGHYCTYAKYVLEKEPK